MAGWASRSWFARVWHVSGPETSVRAGRRRVRISSADKLLFPADGITKTELAAYYAQIAPAMAPHVRDRPLNLWRWNRGIEHDVVVQQEIPRGAPEWVRRVRVARRRGGSVCHAVGGEAATLVWLANLNCITPHVWTARADRPDHPDRLVFDLDPPGEDAGAHFPAIRAGARELGALLRELGLAGFAMTSGSRGLHVVAPLRRRADSDDGARRRGRDRRDACGAAAGTLTTAWRKEKRGGRVLVDVARNTYAQTTVAPYAVRALPGAPVATPLAWEELEDPELHPRRWTLASVPARSPSAATPGRGSAPPPGRCRAWPARAARLDAEALGQLAQRAARIAVERLPVGSALGNAVVERRDASSPGSAISRHVAATPCSAVSAARCRRR